MSVLKVTGASFVGPIEEVTNPETFEPFAIYDPEAPGVIGLEFQRAGRTFVIFMGCQDLTNLHTLIHMAAQQPPRPPVH